MGITSWLSAGVDEAGRGPLAGPVIAAAVIFHPEQTIAGVADSKQLLMRQRERLFEIIQTEALCVAVGRAEVEEIDQFNIFQASLLAMQRAIHALSIKPHEILVDGKHSPRCDIPAKTIVSGDRYVPIISAASIIAKVTRDREMHVLDQQYPGYGFAKHKGYPTAVHIERLQALGPCNIHRRSFAPVKHCIQTESIRL